MTNERTGDFSPERSETRENYGRPGAATETAEARQDFDEREVPSTTGADQGELFRQASYDEYASRWEQIQADFVDDPQATVARADALVSDVINDLTQTFESERNSLENQWSQDAEANTEDLRIALQRYRSFFQRLLSR
ncbi:MAG TPA: hypothetical protein VMR52_11190 [Dehalococcoidia bacterium]|nr:hypothetical protein [Dehalococcoidia bacterium]